MENIKQGAKNVATFGFAEILNFAVSYLAGFAGSKLIATFFVQKKWYDPGTWSAFSKRTAVNGSEYSMYEFWTTYVVGLVIMIVVSRLLKRLFGGSEG